MIVYISPVKTIARIHTDFASKFGVPRQSGLVDSLEGVVVFEEAYRNPDALRGLEDFSHVWLVWGFSGCDRDAWSPTVRPPRLGGERRMGVFATRSPFRPNPIGLSSVRLLGIERRDGLGSVLLVSGIDMMDGTPIYDVKPYLPYTDCHPDATGGFADSRPDSPLSVVIPSPLLARVPETRRDALAAALAADPRPRYQDDPEREYGFGFAGLNVRFRVEGTTLTVFDICDIAGRDGSTPFML
jgi:tRNA (adenine37-N6)-methyltransferase